MQLKILSAFAFFWSHLNVPYHQTKFHVRRKWTGINTKGNFCILIYLIILPYVKWYSQSSPNNCLPSTETSINDHWWWVLDIAVEEFWSVSLCCVNSSGFKVFQAQTAHLRSVLSLRSHIDGRKFSFRTVCSKAEFVNPVPEEAKQPKSVTPITTTMFIKMLSKCKTGLFEFLFVCFLSIGLQLRTISRTPSLAGLFLNLILEILQLTLTDPIEVYCTLDVGFFCYLLHESSMRSWSDFDRLPTPEKVWHVSRFSQFVDIGFSAVH